MKVRFRRRDGVNVGIAAGWRGFQEFRHPCQRPHHVVPARGVADASDSCFDRPFSLCHPLGAKAALDTIDESDQFACLSLAQSRRTALEVGRRPRFDEAGHYVSSHQAVRVHRNGVDQKRRGPHGWCTINHACEKPLPRGDRLTIVGRLVETVFPEALENVTRAGDGASEAGEVVARRQNVQ
jgi:hypothetical protein